MARYAVLPAWERGHPARPAGPPRPALYSRPAMTRSYRYCRECGREGTDRNPLSARGLHNRCAAKRIRENDTQIRAGSGPYHARWRHAMRQWASRI